MVSPPTMVLSLGTVHHASPKILKFRRRRFCNEPLRHKIRANLWFRHKCLDVLTASCLFSAFPPQLHLDLPEFSTRLPMRRSTANHATRTPSHVSCTDIADKRFRVHRLSACRQCNCIN